MDPGRHYVFWMGRTVRNRIQMLPFLAVGAALAACAVAPDSSGEHVEFVFENESRQLCAGSVPHLNSYVERVFDFFEEPVPEAFVVPVHVVNDSTCRHGACYRPGDKEVFTESLDELGARTSGVLRHELSHAVIDRVWGRSVPFFGEGLAEALSPTSDWSQASMEIAPVGGMLDSGTDSLDYTAAARFVRFLIDTRGLARFKRMFQAASERTQSAIRTAFVEIYGEGFDTLEAEFLSGAPRCMFQVDICDMEHAESVGPVWSLAFAASCDDPDFYGSIGRYDETIATQRTIFVESAGAYHLSASSPVLLARCGDCEVQSIPTLVYERDLELQEGHYTLEFTMTKDTVVTLELLSEKAEP